MITLQFIADHSLTSWLIRRFTWSAYSHVDLVLPDGRLLGARGDGGVAIREPEPCPIACRFVVDAPETVLDTALLQLGKPYDWAAIAGIVTRRNWQQPDRWFCCCRRISHRLQRLFSPPPECGTLPAPPDAGRTHGREGIPAAPQSDDSVHRDHPDLYGAGRF